MDLLLRHILVMLGGKYHSLQAHGSAVLIILHRHLTLAVRTQIGKGAVLAHLCQLPCQLVSQGNRVGHQFRRLVGGVAKHHSLISGAYGFDLFVAETGLPGLQGLVHTHGNVGGLSVQGHHHRADIAVKTGLCVIVANLIHRPAHNGRNVKAGSGSNLPCHQDKTGAACGLTGHTAHGILLHAGIQDCVRHGVAELVGMSFCYGL